MIDRRAFLGTLTGSLLAAPRAAEAQPATNMYRIGVLSDTRPPAARESSRSGDFADVFRRSMSDFGYVEGRDFGIEWRNAEGRSSRLDTLASELARLGVDVIVATYPAAVISAKRATTTIPIVMVNTPDPVQLGLVASLARPGGNVTGTTSLSLDLSVKQIELIKESLPRASRIAILWNPENPWHPGAMKELAVRARPSGVQLQGVQVRAPDELPGAFSAMVTERAHAVLVLPDPLTYIHRRYVADLAAKQRLPSIGGPREFAEAGCLLSYWAETTDLYRRAAAYVDRIFKGAKPADLPVEQPTKFELVINLKTAKALGLTIPQSLLQRADQVIE